MKLNLRTILVLALIPFISSCAFFNGKKVDVAINSTPSGADVFIEGKNYGRTPLTLNIEPKPYNAVLVKEGYGSTNLNMEIWWGTIRTNINGERTGDGTRCFLDMMTLIFSFNMYNKERCGDFKEKTYNVVIPKSGNFSKNSTMSVGQNPGDMVPYYYNQDLKKNRGLAR
ncbi:MAG: PEGA domain-containing protein [Rickettsiales bacterium]|nr:PEGA domain-containing protein [Rickettsiales bacterium]